MRMTNSSENGKSALKPEGLFTLHIAPKGEGVASKVQAGVYGVASHIGEQIRVQLIKDAPHGDETTKVDFIDTAPSRITPLRLLGLFISKRTTRPTPSPQYRVQRHKRGLDPLLLMP